MSKIVIDGIMPTQLNNKIKVFFHLDNPFTFTINEDSDYENDIIYPNDKSQEFVETADAIYLIDKLLKYNKTPTILEKDTYHSMLEENFDSIKKNGKEKDKSNKIIILKLDFQNNGNIIVTYMTTVFDYYFYLKSDGTIEFDHKRDDSHVITNILKNMKSFSFSDLDTKYIYNKLKKMNLQHFISSENMDVDDKDGIIYKLRNLNGRSKNKPIYIKSRRKSSVRSSTRQTRRRRTTRRQKPPSFPYMEPVNTHNSRI